MARVSARAIVIKDGSLLLMERWRDGLHYFSVPGGGVEPGETLEQTVVREIQEETSCDVTVMRPLYYLRLANGDESHVFLCHYVLGEPHLPPDSPEAHQPPTNRFLPRWVALTDIVDAPFLVWDPIRRRLLHDLQHGFSDSVETLAR